MTDWERYILRWNCLFDEEISSGRHSKPSEAANRAELRCMKAATPGEKYAYVLNLVTEMAIEDRRRRIR